jgi:glutaconate CoA-transferase subunit A
MLHRHLDREARVTRIAPSLDEALASIADGCSLLVPRESCGVAMEATRALIRRGARRLTLIAVPTSSLQADLLIGAGCVETIETAGVSLGELGAAPQFTAAVLADRIAVRDTTCPAVHAALQAAEKGIPFIPLRGLIGSDVLSYRPDWRVIDNPFAPNDPIVVLPALQPDVALFHVPLADRFGNVWIGRERELMLMAHAARRTVVTAEALFDGNLLDDPLRAPATLAGFYVEAVTVAPRGAWPLSLPGHYPADDAHLADYARLAATPAGFGHYLERHVHERRAA